MSCSAARPRASTTRPIPGELGKRIYQQVSKEAWQRWVAHQTMLINEYRLTPIEPKARQFLVAEMEKFLFGAGAAEPQGFVAPQGDSRRSLTPPARDRSNTRPLRGLHSRSDQRIQRLTTAR